jgi:hypothetical protein
MPEVIRHSVAGAVILAIRGSDGVADLVPWEVCFDAAGQELCGDLCLPSAAVVGLERSAAHATRIRVVGPASSGAPQARRGGRGCGRPPRVVGWHIDGVAVNRLL